MRTIIALLCVFSCAAILLGGCSTAGPGPDVPTGPQFRDRTSPENVIYNLELGYEQMDLEEYLDCLSEDFEFFPTEEDVNNPEWELPLVWWKTNEAEMHGHMFDDNSDVDDIQLTLTIVSIEYDYGIPDDVLDDTCVCMVDVSLLVYLANGMGLFTTSPSQFDMRIDTDQPNPVPDPEDELWWEIECWYDIGGEQRGAEAGRVEDATWGSIKAMYW